MSYIQTAVSASNLPVVNAANQGGFWSYGLYQLGGTATGTAFVGVANEVRVVQFTLPVAQTLGRVTFSVQTGAAASNASFGIYSADGATKLVDSGLVSTATSSTNNNVGTFSAVTLPPGIYWFAYTNTSTSVTQRQLSIFTNTDLAAVYNVTTPRIGVAPNAATAGALPASLGTLASITTAANNICVCFWER